MTVSFDPDRDLAVTRVIKAPRAAVWNAWTDPASFEQWWVPAPARSKVVAMELRPGGSFVTHISEDGGAFGPHLAGCFLAVDAMERIVFTDALLGGWRPSGQPFMTAVITFRDHPDGTDYAAHAMHRSDADRNMHEQMGFFDGWGTVVEQLARLVERPGVREGADNAQDRPAGDDHDRPRSVAPPSVLPDISPARGEIGRPLWFRQSAALTIGEISQESAISPLEGEMSGPFDKLRTERGATECNVQRFSRPPRPALLRSLR